MTRRPVPLGIVLLAAATTACASEPPGPVDGVATTPIPENAVALRFEAAPGDTVRVYRDGSGEVVLAAAPDDAGFLSGLIPALTQERRIRRVALDGPYWFLMDDDGIPLLADPSTGQNIDLGAFGPGARDFVAAVVALPAPPVPPASEEDA